MTLSKEFSVFSVRNKTAQLEWFVTGQIANFLSFFLQLLICSSNFPTSFLSCCDKLEHDKTNSIFSKNYISPQNQDITSVYDSLTHSALGGRRGPAL